MKTFERFLILFFLFCLAACASTPSQQSIGTDALVPPAITSLPPASVAPAAADVETIPSIAQSGLAGRLILIRFGQKGNKLVELDLGSGQIKTLYQAPDKSWLALAVVSPDRQDILLAYSPPPHADAIQFGYTDLYLLTYDGSSQPRPFLTRDQPDESFLVPTWAPDGGSIFYTHLRRLDSNSQVPTYQNDIEEVKLDGEVKTIIEHALWPALSPDGGRLSFLYEDPVNFGNDLYIANRDGTDQAPVIAPGSYPPIDAHVFTADGAQLIFSMVTPQTAPAASLWDKLFGVQVASAHNVPSDWYAVPAAGGDPQRLTLLNDVNLNGSLSPDGGRMAFICASGLYVINIDGSGLIQLTNEMYIGTADWIP
jgi:Tol biopolymer transport system component